ncbi:MAG TPA: hypothetical protein VMH36_16885 [Alphaproteobacteria bacterium]|nr:hypothetical protein [Alphaproteobacteria bacterium]
MANDQNGGRDLARQHLEAIEAALAQVNTRLTSTKLKFERAFKAADPADPTRLGFELEQAAFELERRQLNVMRDAAKAQYLKTFKSPETGSR